MAFYWLIVAVIVGRELSAAFTGIYPRYVTQRILTVTRGVVSWLAVV